MQDLKDFVTNPFIVIGLLFYAIWLLSRWAKKVNGPNYRPPMPTDEEARQLNHDMINSPNGFDPDFENPWNIQSATKILGRHHGDK
jgi:hypothetical protein